MLQSVSFLSAQRYHAGAATKSAQTRPPGQVRMGSANNNTCSPGRSCGSCIGDFFYNLLIKPFEKVFNRLSEILTNIMDQAEADLRAEIEAQKQTEQQTSLQDPNRPHVRKWSLVSPQPKEDLLMRLSSNRRSRFHSLSDGFKQLGYQNGFRPMPKGEGINGYSKPMTDLVGVLLGLKHDHNVPIDVKRIARLAKQLNNVMNKSVTTEKLDKLVVEGFIERQPHISHAGDVKEDLDIFRSIRKSMRDDILPAQKRNTPVQDRNVVAALEKRKAETEKALQLVDRLAQLVDSGLVLQFPDMLDIQ